MFICIYNNVSRQIRLCGNRVSVALVGRAGRVEPEQLKDAGERRSVTTVARRMGDE